MLYLCISLSIIMSTVVLGDSYIGQGFKHGAQSIPTGSDLDMGIRRNLDRAKRGPLATTMDHAYHGSDKRIRLG